MPYSVNSDQFGDPNPIYC